MGEHPRGLVAAPRTRGTADGLFAACGYSHTTCKQNFYVVNKMNARYKYNGQILYGKWF